MAVSLFFSACGNKRQEKISDDYVELVVSESQGTSSDADKTNQNGMVPKEVIAEGSGEFGDVKIKCKTDITSLDNLMIYNVENEKIDDKYIIDLAQRIFDDGAYEVLNPYGTMPDDELDKIHKEYSENGVYGGDSMITILPVSAFKDFDRVVMSEDEIIVKTNSFGGAEECRLRGKMLGNEYELMYLNVDGEQCITMYRLNNERNYISSSRYNEGIWGIGQPLVKREEADKQVEDFIKKLGYSDFEKASVCTRWSNVWVDKKDASGDYGYVYTYKRNIAGIKPIDYFNGIAKVETLIKGPGCEDVDELYELYEDDSIAYLEDRDTFILWEDTFGIENGIVPGALYDAERIKVDVDDNGIVNVIIKAFDNPSTVQGERLKTLSYEQCIDAANEAIAYSAPLIDYNRSSAIDKMTLYTSISYHKITLEEKEVYMPILVFELLSDDQTIEDYYQLPREALFGVSLVDGSNVYFNVPHPFEIRYYE